MTYELGISPVSAQERLERSGFKAIKSLGQHFLTDRAVLEHLVEFAGPIDGSHVLEIGPGPGGLSEELLRAGCGHLDAIEKDPRWSETLLPLGESYPNRFNLMIGDAQRLEFSQLRHPPQHIVANLPYNIATSLITRWLTSLDAARSVKTISVLLQREVADRIAASCSNRKQYGRLSVLAKWRAKVELGPHVEPEAFVPQPKVMSRMVKLRLYPAASDAQGMVVVKSPDGAVSSHMLEQVSAAAFSARRKMLRTSLLSLFGADLDRALLACGIDPNLRADQIEPGSYVKLARQLFEKKRNSESVIGSGAETKMNSTESSNTFD